MRAWLTPDQSELEATSEDCRVISVNPNLWLYVSGALLELTYHYRWEQFGDATPEDTAQFFTELWSDFIVSQCCYIGECRPFAFSPPPSKWISFGTTVLASSYPELAAVIPAAWIIGANIQLPPAAGRSLVGNGTVSGFPYPLGGGGGNRQHTLTAAEMPAHTHTELIPVNTPNLSGVEAPTIAASIGSSVTGSTGGGQPHNNLPPYLVVHWAIYAGR